MALPSVSFQLVGSSTGFSLFPVLFSLWLLYSFNEYRQLVSDSNSSSKTTLVPPLKMVNSLLAIVTLAVAIVTTLSSWLDLKLKA